MTAFKINNPAIKEFVENINRVKREVIIYIGI